MFFQKVLALDKSIGYYRFQQGKNPRFNKRIPDNGIDLV